MTFQQMQYFIEVANCRSFSRAARNLFLSQPNLTKYIANLEKELGMKLFDRTTHRVELTPAGRQLLNKTEVLFSQLSRAIDEVQISSRSSTQVTPVMIGVSCDECIPGEVADLIRALNAMQPLQYRYILEQSGFTGLISRLREGQYDLVINSDKNMKRSYGLSYLNLRAFDLLLAVNRRHPQALETGLRPNSFGDTPVFFALPDGREAGRQAMDSVFHQTGGVTNLQLMNTPGDLMLNVQAGGGVAIVSSLIDQSKYPDVVFHTFEENHGQKQFLCWRSGDAAPGVQRFLERIRQLYPGRHVHQSLLSSPEE